MVHTMESMHVVTLPLPGMSKESMQIHILSAIMTDPLISLGVLCDYRSTIKLDKHTMTVHSNGQKIQTGHRNKQKNNVGSSTTEK